jgi:tRNA threonylcarbamoyladenosine biosynthesis protein TsaE
MVYQSSSSENTKKFAADLAEKIIKHGSQKNAATIITLQGDLGAGKTTFVQGFYKSLDIQRIPASPTFILMRRTAMPRRHREKSGFKNIYHVDAYRIKNPKDMHVLGFKEFLADPTNLFLIEWPERLKGILPKKRTTIKLTHGKTSEKRTIRVFGGLV